MTSAVPLIHSALEFRLQILCRAMCNSNTPIGKGKDVAANIPLVLCNKHGLRKCNSIVAYRFFSNLADEKYTFKDKKFSKYDEDKVKEIGSELDLSFFVDHPKVNQELLQLLFYSLETAVDFYNHLNEVKDMRLSEGWMSESDYRYYKNGEMFIIMEQRRSYKNVMPYKNKSVKMIEVMNYFVQKSTELIRLLDVKLSSYYVMYDLKKK